MIYLFLADGFEETEALVPVDFLRRVGIEVTTVGVSGKTVTGAHSIKVIADREINEVIPGNNTDGIILPGGMPGTLNLEKCGTVKSFIEYSDNNKKMIAAICAAPSILGHMGLLDGKNATCFPGFENDLYGASLSDKFTVTDGNIITSKGAGSATDFAFEIIKYLCSTEKAEEIKAQVQCCYR